MVWQRGKGRTIVVNDTEMPRRSNMKLVGDISGRDGISLGETIVEAVSASISAPVASLFLRNGDVTAQTGDYGGGLVFHDANASGVPASDVQNALLYLDSTSSEAIEGARDTIHDVEFDTFITAEPKHTGTTLAYTGNGPGLIEVDESASFPVGSVIHIRTQESGEVNVTALSGTLRVPEDRQAIVRSESGGAHLIKLATDDWILGGDLVPTVPSGWINSEMPTISVTPVKDSYTGGDIMPFSNTRGTVVEFDHDLALGTVTVQRAGLYRVTMSATAARDDDPLESDRPVSFRLMRNGVNTEYAVTAHRAGTQLDLDMALSGVIITTLLPGDVMSVKWNNGDGYLGAGGVANYFQFQYIGP